MTVCSPQETKILNTNLAITKHASWVGKKVLHHSKVTMKAKHSVLWETAKESLIAFL